MAEARAAAVAVEAGYEVIAALVVPTTAVIEAVLVPEVAVSSSSSRDSHNHSSSFNAVASMTQTMT